MIVYVYYVYYARERRIQVVGVGCAVVVQAVSEKEFRPEKKIVEKFWDKLGATQLARSDRTHGLTDSRERRDSELGSSLGSREVTFLRFPSLARVG